MIQVRQQSSEIIGKKRKSVKFVEPVICMYESATSTHEFLSRNVGKISGQDWEELAEKFNCSKDLAPEEDTSLMNELLELCSFFKEEEDTYGFETECFDDEDEEDSEDEEMFRNLRLAADKEIKFVQPRLPANRGVNLTTTARQPSVSDLRFNSQLRLGSSIFSGDGDDIDNCLPSASSAASCSSSQATSAYFSGSCEDLESAFQGVIQGDNFSENDSTKKNTSQDFWGDVDF